MKKLIHYLSIDNIGVLELLFASYCILSGYSWGIVKGNLLFLFIMAIMAYIRKGKSVVKMKELTWLVTFVAIHEFVLAMVINAPGYMINNTVSILISCILIYPIVRALNIEKLLGALNLVGIISIIGIVYHYIIIRNGGAVSPIPLPFMPGLDTASRLYEEGNRPTSFYWEPAAFATYMMVPLFLALRNKKFIWSMVIIVSMFLSTSTTGITMSLFMLVCYLFTQKINIKYKALIVVITGAFIWSLFYTDLFSAGMDKMAQTDIESTSRTINGPSMVFNMPLNHIIMGMPAANPYDYFMSGGFYSSDIVVKDGSIYCSTIWLVLAKYGIVGMLLFLWLYIKPMKVTREITPFILVLFVSMFFQSFTIGTSGFAFQIIFIYVFINAYKIRQIG